MPIQALDNLVRANQLKQSEASPAEIRGLVMSGRARLADAQRNDLSLASRFDLAYNAAHALSLAALRWHGYRSEHRYTVFQCLVHTLDLPNEQWRVLAEAHRRRNMAEYEGEIELEESQVNAVCRIAVVVADRVQRLVGRNR
jgi:hypothetical protein